MSALIHTLAGTLLTTLAARRLGLEPDVITAALAFLALRLAVGSPSTSVHLIQTTPKEGRHE